MKKRTNKHYAERLRKQLAQAEWVAKNAWRESFEAQTK
jgi:hypothetical protein